MVTHGKESPAGGGGGFRAVGAVCVRRAVAPSRHPSDAASFLAGYFRLDLPLREIHAEIAGAHPAAADAVRQFEGLRILRQDPLETILTFSIATATNVPRVTRSIRETCARFGSVIAVVDGVT